ncbi:NUDIX domain-containing protein [Streptomyces umbrinus]
MKSEFDQGLPRKRIATGVLFFDALDRVLIVDPIYKNPWEIPGGAVETNESPRAAATREVHEELGFTFAPGRLLGIDWTTPRTDRSEGLVFIFDGGRLTPEQISAMRLPPEELKGSEFVPAAELEGRLIPLLARRVQACLRARAHNATTYMENGVSIT